MILMATFSLGPSKYSKCLDTNVFASMPRILSADGFADRVKPEQSMVITPSLMLFNMICSMFSVLEADMLPRVEFMKLHKAVIRVD